MTFIFIRFISFIVKKLATLPSSAVACYGGQALKFRRVRGSRSQEPDSNIKYRNPKSEIKSSNRIKSPALAQYDRLLSVYIFTKTTIVNTINLNAKSGLGTGEFTTTAVIPRLACPSIAMAKAGPGDPEFFKISLSKIPNQVQNDELLSFPYELVAISQDSLPFVFFAMRSALGA
jgi:hypothetical protein